MAGRKYGIVSLYSVSATVNLTQESLALVSLIVLSLQIAVYRGRQEAMAAVVDCRRRSSGSCIRRVVLSARI